MGESYNCDIVFCTFDAHDDGCRGYGLFLVYELVCTLMDPERTVMRKISHYRVLSSIVLIDRIEMNKGSLERADMFVGCLFWCADGFAFKNGAR